MKLFHDQEQIVSEVEQSMIARNRRVLVRAETGSGKTIMATNILHRARQKRNTTWFVVPRKQLLKQTAVTYEYFDLPHSYIASGMEYDMFADNYICSLQTLIKRFDELTPPKLAIIDECFTGDTKIKTINGEKSIAEVSLGDIVFTADGCGEVSAISKRKAQQIYKVTLNDKRIIRCTGNHPFLSEQGWVECKNLERGSFVVSLQDMPWMWSRISTASQIQQIKKWGKESIPSGDRGVLPDEVLLNILFEESRERDAYTRSEGACIADIKENWAQTAYSWWKRYGYDDASKEGFGDDGQGLEGRTGSKHKNAERFWLSLSLQDRCREYQVKKSDRSGRSLSQSIQKKRDGQKERQFPSGTWVESVEIEQCGSGEAVYNLQINGHPSYFANGVLVHNCHFDFGLGALFAWFKKHGTYVIGLSATPMLANGDGLDKWYDHMVSGLDLRSLIDLGRLSDYRYFEANAPDKSALKAHGKRDYTKQSITDWSDVHGKYIVGNAIELYKEHAHGKLGIHFSPSVAESKRTAKQYNDAGIPAAHMDGDTPDDVREWVIRKYADREIFMLCNVDLMTFGFDLAAQVGRDVMVETMIDGGPTKSLTKQRQKWGRALRRKLEPATIFDLVGNQEMHNYPCTEIDWSLDGRERKVRKESEREVKMRQCTNCPRCHPPAPKCPHCGHVYPVQEREIEHVEGLVQEVDKEAIRSAKKAKRMEVGQAKTRLDLERIAQQRGYKRGWVYQMAKVKGIQL